MNFGLDPSSLAVPAFIAGLLTFLAPCTLPLLPAYLGFISGVSQQELNSGQVSVISRKKIFLNAIGYVIGFSLVFIVLGSLFGIGGAALVKFRLPLSRLSGALVIFFGLFMLASVRWPIFKFLNYEGRWRLEKVLRPGTVYSSILFGASFAFGWTPCIGPVLGSVLLLASSSATAGQGAWLLTIFSLGLALPFLLVAGLISLANKFLARWRSYLNVVNFVGGIFLIILGWLMLSGQFAVWLTYIYKIFNFINYEAILKYL